MHHLSDEEYQAAKADILGGMEIYYQSYFAYARIYRGILKLDVPLDLLPAEWGATFGSLSHAEEAIEALLGLETFLQQGKDSSDMEALVDALLSMGQKLQEIYGFMNKDLPPTPGVDAIHTHYCPLCEAVFPCSDGPEDCDQLQELWCDSCRVKQGGIE